MTEHRLTVSRTARYYQLGDLSAATRRVWFVCHGYGQLAAYFIRHFASLAEADPALVVVAPEGLSQFYLQGNSGRVGASWMTREDRLSEIEDHVGFLNQLASLVLANCPAGVDVTVLGFSQGTSTISRWLTRAPFRPQRLILWAGSFPEDIEPATAAALLQSVDLTLVVGSQDEFITPERLQQLREQLQQLGVQPRFISFEGKHEMNAAVLRQLA
jgi:predicted esterase